MLRLRTILLCNNLYVVILCLTLLYALIITKIISYESNYVSGDICLNAVLNKYREDGDKLNIEIKRDELIVGTYYFNSLDAKNKLLKDLEYGSRLSVCGELKEPLNNTIPNTFNYKEHLYNKKIYFQMNVSSIEVLDDAKGLNILLNTFKNRADDIDSKGYIKTFILGDINDIDYEVYKGYQKNGVTHLFSISGMHISLFAMSILFILKKFKVSEIKRYLIVSIILFIYVFLTGFASAIQRAFLMFLLLSINKIFYLEIDAKNILLLTVSILILLDPFIIYNLGFQYSVMTTFGIIHNTDYLNKGNYFMKLLKVSIIAFLYSIPISWLNFYEVNLFSVFINLIIVPIVSYIIYPLALITFIMPIFYNLFLITINILEILNRFFGNINIFYLILPKVSLIVIILFYMFLIMAKTKKSYWIFILLIVCIFKLKPLFNSSAEIYYFDVGQGSSSLIIYPYQKFIVMIDTGGVITYKKEEWMIKNKEYQLSDNIVTFLKSKGINKLDLLILSHGDQDHVGETQNIMKNITVKKLWLNMNELNNNEIDIVNSGIDYIQSNCYKNILNLNEGNYTNENDNSQITYLEVYNYKLLFMGDVSKTVEKDHMNKFGKVNFLLLGHHGSKTSSDYDFLKAVNPEISIITSGRNNRYNHPSIETIESLEKLNLDYYNTQDSGTIFIKINSKAHTIIEYKP